MSKNRVSNEEVIAIDQRFKKMQRNEALRSYRKARVGKKSVDNRVAQVKASDAAARAAREAAAKPAPVADTANDGSMYVVMTLPLNDPAIVFKSVAVVMQIGASIADRVALNYVDAEMAAALSSVIVPVSKLGQPDFRVYPTLAAAQAAADLDNATLNEWKALKLASKG